MIKPMIAVRADIVTDMVNGVRKLNEELRNS